MGSVDDTGLPLGALCAFPTLFSPSSARASSRQEIRWPFSYRTEATIKKNGNSYVEEGTQLWTFDADGKVLEFVGYSDTAAVLKAWTG